MVVRNGPASFCGAGGVKPTKVEGLWELVSMKGHCYDPAPGENRSNIKPDQFNQIHVFIAMTGYS